VKKSKPISDDDDLASKDDDDQPNDDDDDANDRDDDDREDHNTAKVQTAYTNRRRRRRGGSCCSLQDSKAAAVASTTAVSTNSDLQPAAEERIKDEVEMEVDVELEEEEESRVQFLGLTSAPVQQQLSLEERQLREAEAQLEEQLPPDQLVYDFSSSDYLLPFDDLKFYMDQEERTVPQESQQQQELEPFLPDSSSESGFVGTGLNGFHAGPTLLQPLLPASSQFPWSPVEAPPPVTPLPRYDHISPSSSFDKDRDVNIEAVSGRLLELVQPQPHVVRRLTSCPSCHCDLSFTAAAAAVVSPPQLSCDSFLSFPENSLDIEKFL
jgi:hypothetical protein